MKKITLLIATVTLVINTYIIHQLPSPKPNITTQITQAEPLTSAEINKIDAINAINSTVKSISADVDISLKINGQRYSLKASVVHEKPRNFHLAINSLAGTEADLGANQWHFWYWFNRKEPDTVFYGVYEHATSEIPINPVWLSQCLGLFTIEKDCKVVHLDDFVAFVRKNNNSVYATIVKDTSVVGYYVYTNDGQLVAYCDIKENIKDYNIPKSMTISFPKENVFMELKLSNHKINEDVKESFVIPQKANQNLIR